MKTKIIPITSLRDTSKIEKLVKEENGPIFVTKNGFESMVIMRNDYYDNHFSTEEIKDVVSNSSSILSCKKQSKSLGFVRVMAPSIEVEVGNVSYNVAQIKKALKKAEENEVEIVCFQELSISSYTCGDFFLTDSLLNKSLEGLKDLKEFSKSLNLAFCVGLPLQVNNSLYNVAAFIHKGKILGIVPKKNIPNYSEFYEKRYFDEGIEGPIEIELFGEKTYFGTNLFFVDEDYPDLKIGIEICEDLWVPSSPSSSLALAGATLILNLSSSNETVSKANYRRDLVRMNSAKLICGYVYADSGMGESTTDLVFSSHQIICENGSILSEAKPFKFTDAISDVDIEKLSNQRRKMTSFKNKLQNNYKYLTFALDLKKKDTLLRHYNKNPFIPEKEEIDLERVESILTMQAYGLLKRLKTIHQNKVIIGLSGGLDSTLALLVAHVAFKIASYPFENILAVTLPCFGTSKRTHDNAKALSEALGVSFKEINIASSVSSHFKEIGHDIDNHNVVYENAQARERTQVLMDLANDTNALMIGTGDLSELCLGWCTYNGDHMSMYGVNASIPKTLVRYLCRGYAELNKKAAPSLLDIIDTPISPELLPLNKGQIEQKTEDKIGPYELHDFFIYHHLRFGYSPTKLFYLAQSAYRDSLSNEEIKKWLRLFFTRFYHNQFKRSCLPDGPKVGSVAISPRGDLRLPSDASVDDILNEIDRIIY